MEGEYFRTFIGVPVSAGPETLKLRTELIRLLEEERISWLDPELYHVTLRFLGDTPENKVKDIIRVLDEKVRLPVKSEITLTGPGSFGQRRNPRVIWLGFDAPELFNQLKEQVDSALENEGISIENRPFTAHLTLARIRSLNNPGRVHQILEEKREGFGEKTRPERMVYFRSLLGDGPPRYLPLSVFPFRD